MKMPQTGLEEINGDLLEVDLWLDGWITRNYAEWMSRDIDNVPMWRH